MLWRNKKYYDSILGELILEGGLWSVEKLIEGQTIEIQVDGNNKEPSIESLKQARSILNNMDNVIGQAIKFLSTKQILNSKLELDGFSTYLEKGKYDISFGLSDNEIEVVVVQFENELPYDFSIID